VPEEFEEVAEAPQLRFGYYYVEVAVDEEGATTGRR
jgi:hypothetical protein